MLEPRVKILWFVGMTLMVVFTYNPFVLALLLLSSFTIWGISGLWKDVLNLLRQLWPLLALACCTWVIIGAFQENSATNIIVKTDFLSLERVDVQKALVSVMRIFLMVSTFYTLIMTTDFSSLIHGLRKLRIPYPAAFMIGLTLQIIPIMIHEFQTISSAQRSRGLELEKGGLIQRIKNYSKILFPLFIRSIHMGHSLSLSMHLNDLDLKRKRSSYKEIKLTSLDVKFVFGAVIIWAASIYIGYVFPI